MAMPREELVVVSGIGCSGRTAGYFNVDSVHSTHGRAIAVAEGIKLANPKLKVIVFSGDGDLVGIGGNHFLHAARRNADLTVICINNAIYGMTGGQMAPTTILGMKTSTTPYGRDAAVMGNPLNITALVAQLPGAYYVTRQSVHTAQAIRKLKKAIETSLRYQKEGHGTCFIEVVSNCPSGWKMTPVESNKWLEKTLFPHYPVGDLKVPKQ
jgi:2-oxoglutarate ferredoxin oxidoreductase subunit beta